MPKEYIHNKKKVPIGSNGGGIFSTQSSPEARIILNHEQLIKYAEACRNLNLSIVMTSGTFDLLHIGHAKYLEKAKSYGDVLIVAVDSDEKVKERKGELRPIVPEMERVEMLAHLRSVDILTLKYTSDPKWALIRSICPDTLVVTKETYSENILKELAKYCGRIVSLEPQATTSTTAQIRKLQVGWTNRITEPAHKILEEFRAPKELRKKLDTILKQKK